MEALVLNTNFDTIAVVDQFESFIWTDRYIGAGDFELYLPAESKLNEFLKVDNYLWNKDSRSVMIIEAIELVTDPESGDHITISGRSLESILERRVVWKFTELSGNVQNGIQKLLNENAINPSISARRFPTLSFKASSDPKVTSLSFDAATQYLGDNLYEVITDICTEFDLGFRITLTESNGFCFELYAGVDHSWDQTDNPCVVFSPKYDNLLDTRYYESKLEFKNAALVGGTGEGADKITAEATNGSYTGLDRREIFVSSSLSNTRENAETGETEDIPEAEYKEMLVADAKTTFAENKEAKYFDGQVEARRQFIYGRDFDIGDVVQVINEYNMDGKCRVMELVFTHDNSGETVLPTFSSLDTAEDQN